MNEKVSFTTFSCNLPAKLGYLPISYLAEVLPLIFLPEMI